MDYKELIDELAKRCLEPRYVIKKILSEMPHVIREKLEHGDYLLTPLGTFSAKHRQPREYVIPASGGKVASSKERVEICLKPGPKMKTFPGDMRWGRLSGEDKCVGPSPDEDEEE